MDIFEKQAHLSTLFQTNPVDAAYAHALASGKRVMGKHSDVVDIALLLLDQVKTNEFFDYQVYFVSELSKALETNDLDVLILNRASLLQRAQVVRSWGLLYQRDQKRRVVFEARAVMRRPFLDPRDLAHPAPRVLIPDHRTTSLDAAAGSRSPYSDGARGPETSANGRCRIAADRHPRSGSLAV